MQIFELVKQNAKGRWSTIIPALTGIDASMLTPGKNGPCPKCGGTDRFKVFTDFPDTGGVFCNQCKPKGASGIDVLVWYKGITSRQAVEEISDYLGIERKRRKDVSKTIAKSIEWREWNDPLANYFISNHAGFTKKAMQLMGLRFCKYKKTYQCIAFPWYGKDLNIDKPVGYTLMQLNGEPLPVFDRDGNVVDHVSKKNTYGSKSGFIGLNAVKCLRTVGLPELIWKCEGVSDALALQDLIPEELVSKHLVLTNACGAKEKGEWMKKFLSQHPCNVLHDRDVPGQQGAEQLCFDVAAMSEKSQIRNLQIPYDLQDTKGKDVRDWIVEGATYADLLNLAEETQPTVVKRDETGNVAYNEHDFPIFNRIINKLQINVLYETPSRGVRIFSLDLRKATIVFNINRLTKTDFIQICGGAAMHAISTEPDNENSFAIEDVRNAISWKGCSKREKKDERGVGVWLLPPKEGEGKEPNTVFTVNHAEGARWDGDHVFRKMRTAEIGDVVMDYGSMHPDWYDYKTLENYVRQAEDTEWCSDVIDRFCSILSGWVWRYPDIDPLLITGLVLASWTQTCWKWRPLVSVSGESNSGKSIFFELLGGGPSGPGIFGNLAFKTSKSTAAGVRQGVANTGMIVLLDEFEASKERDKALEMFRASTRGDIVAMGTAKQKGLEHKLQHLVWIAATETGLSRQPDLNRFIQLHLDKPPREDHGKLVLPDSEYLIDFGQRLLAIAIRSIVRARRVSVQLKSSQFPKIDARTVECYAVPVSILAAAQDLSEDDTLDLLKTLMGGVDDADQGKSDHEELLEDILGATVHCGSRDGELTVSQILASYPGQWYQDHAHKLEAKGVRFSYEHDLFVAHEITKKQLLKATDWKFKRIDQILSRLPGTEKAQLRISGGGAKRGTIIPKDLINLDPTNDEQPKHETNGAATHKQQEI